MVVRTDLTPIRVLIADDHPLLREGIAALITGQNDIKMVAEAANGEKALEQYRLHRPDVTLMDLQMPIMSGIEAITAIRRESPKACIVVLTTYVGDAQVGRALKAGARGYVLKGYVHKALLDTIRSVHAGHKRISPEIAAELAAHVGEEELSAREIDVLRLIAVGNANKHIAAQLCISDETVKSHITNILKKLRANDRTQAVTTAIKRGIIEL
jgi:DNA-binding NarL/FixJ family response regulator